MSDDPPTIDNVLTDLPGRDVSRLCLPAIARAAWKALRAGSELFGVLSFLAWLAQALAQACQLG